MQDILSNSLKKLRMIRLRRTRMVAILLVLSLLVSLDVFWILRRPGLTLAGNADCRTIEHTHDALCSNEESPCILEEHVHSIECYADKTAHVETQLDWQRMFADYPFTDDLRENLVGIAKTQAGYRESDLNFEVDDNGIRRGYTRYGAWYGAPYSDWSAMFVSFCLHYAGADPNEFPGNTGAASMAELWKNLDNYADAGTYTPEPGDLVFFNNNTVGIVTEAQTSTVYVIQGNMDDAVQGNMIAMTDSSIAGWGIVEAPPEIAEPPAETEPIPEENPVEETDPPAFDPGQIDPLDISNGPVFLIFADDQPQPQAQRYALRTTQSVIQLLPYLISQGGDYFFTLMDQNNQELPKDADGNYIAQANDDYKLAITFTSPNGLKPGTYEYQVPNGLMVDGGEGTFVLQGGITVGSWTVTDTGLITMVFNDEINSRTDITISATMGIHFPEQEEPIDFDGKIIVSVEKPPAQSHPTKLNKWGSQGGTEGSNGTDPSKIYWSLEIVGDADSQIPGSILTDHAIYGEWSKTHKFTESDLAGGLSFGVSENGNWHSWHIPGDDPHLVWTETGWSYKMPETAVCEWCGEIELGNEGWYYYVHYSSTPDPAGSAGTFGYENDATIDGAYGYAWVNFTHGEATGEILKTGSFASDANGGTFIWEFQASIPGRQEGKRADYNWYIMDTMRVLDSSGQLVSMAENDAHLSTVTATINGTTIQIPRIQDATSEDLFAWDNAWTASENGINHGREFNLLMRCQCTPDTCHWGNGCGDYWYIKDDGTAATNGFCQCWTATENITFTFVYTTQNLDVIEAYGGLNYQLQNIVDLYYVPEGASGGVLVSKSDAIVPIPGLFKKELTHDFDGYTANYKVTVNEAKAVLTNGSPLYIHDVMTDTLAYISGSLVITAEDANGNITTLQQGNDYTVEYDGSSGQLDEAGNKVHVLDIVILHPQPVMYTLDYDATLILPEQITGSIKYSNSATITLWGEAITDSSTEKVYADINISAKSYQVEIHKVSAATGESLGGATFGIYNQNGGLISTAVTNANGKLFFQTNVEKGIILREHMLYYLQELDAPPGYQLDDTKHWFCFCDNANTNCNVCNELAADTDTIRIPLEQIGYIRIENKLLEYDLPATGGSGIYPLILASVTFIVTPLVYGFILRRKRERRGVG